MKLPFKLFALLSFYSITIPLLASETGYEVELIIFEDANARYIQSEDWGYNDMLNNITAESADTDAVEPAITKQDPEYKQLPWEGAKLSAQLERISKNNNYRVLAVKRWKQTGLDREHAFTISINSVAISVPETTTDDKLNAPPKVEAPSELVAEEQNTQTDTTPYLIGNVKLIMSRYLHFNVNIQYIKPTTDENGEIEKTIYPIINERRMRSREIHYIDHPLVGIIVLATPYKILSTEEQNGEQANTNDYKTM